MHIRKTLALIAALLIFLPCAAPALTLSAETVTPFDNNQITVQTDSSGTLTLIPAMQDFDLMPIASSEPVEAGQTRIIWDGLSWNGEPVAAGWITLNAALTDASGSVRETSLRLKVGKPLCAAVSCLPFADRFCPEDGALKIDCGLTGKGKAVLQIASAEKPGKVLRTIRQNVQNNVPAVLQWDGRDKNKRRVADGEYLLTLSSAACPDVTKTASITVTRESTAVPDLFVTGSLLPADPENDEEVWSILTAPSVVGAGTEGQGLYIMKKKTYSPAGSISCRTAALRVLEVGEDGWNRVGAWRQGLGEYIEGYVQRSKLTVIPARQSYGVLINKQKQTLTVYQEGKRIGTFRVSTGLQSAKSPLAATPPGVYLVGSRMKDFQNDGHHYDYPIRLHGDYLLHTLGYRLKDGVRSYSAELAELGSPASHGCIRMDVRATAESSGLNAWWIWTHLGRDTRVIVTEGP